ncbi:MAG: aminotransferase class V-fold PLP-dependent enzyme, partial [Acetobacteraceae bacterium]|nr:aminotransferase class V-fold PLP-dependent enzyme [Acetobacteraceae bacterium]
MAYFDANASEPLRPEAREAVLRALDWTGNPASVHRHGRNARRTLETARETLAARFGAAVAGVVFTSGGTEANALAIHGLRGGRRVIASAVEHDAVRAAAPDAITLPVRRDGRADLDRLPELLGEAGPALVCLMLANNETGVLQPVAEAAALCRAHGALLHVDAVQAVGRVDVDLRALGAHALAVSSHKIGGPTGAGALLLAPDAPPIAAHLPGGGQESGRRGGTPALAMVAGFAAACREAVAPTGTAALRDGIDRAAVATGAQICGGDALRLPNTTCLALPGV